VRLGEQVAQWWRKLRPRYRQIVFCCISEMIMFLALFAQFANFRQSLHHVFQEQVTAPQAQEARTWRVITRGCVLALLQAGGQVRMMDMTYQKKVDEIALLAKCGHAQRLPAVSESEPLSNPILRVHVWGLACGQTGWAGTKEVRGFMSGLGGVKSCNCSAATVSSLIAYDVNYIQMEYGMVSQQPSSRRELSGTAHSVLEWGVLVGDLWNCVGRCLPGSCSTRQHASCSTSTRTARACTTTPSASCPGSSPTPSGGRYAPRSCTSKTLEEVPPPPSSAPLTLASRTVRRWVIPPASL
jgi:hypothetical protein